MDIRLTELSDRVQYFLDCAQEATEMDSCTGMTLYLYGNDAAMAAIIEAPREHPDHHFKARRAVCIDLAGYANTILAKLPRTRAAGLIAMGMRHLTHEIVSSAETMSYMCIEDEIDGGCLKPYRRERARSRNGVTFKRTARRLKSPKFIRRYVKHNREDVAHLFDLHLIMMFRARTIAEPRKDETISRDWQTQLDAIRRRNDLRRQQMIAGFEAERATNHVDRRVLVKLRPRWVRHNRKVIRRSLDIATSLLGTETVRSFLRGDPVKLIGRESMLVVRKTGSLTRRGHGALSVAIADTQGRTLADLCTYIEDTPCLDQLVGFALWMNAGEDRAVMQTANIIHVENEEAYKHPLLAERRKDQAERALAALRELPENVQRQIMDIVTRPERPVQHQLSHEERRARSDLYFEMTRGEWIEALMVAVIGYRNFPIYRQAGAL